MALKGSSSTIEARVLQQHPRKQHALHLAAGQRADGAVLETVEAHRRERLRNPVARGLPMPPKNPVERQSPVPTKSNTEIGKLRSISAVCGR